MFISDSFTVGLKASSVSFWSCFRCVTSQQSGQETIDRLKLSDCNHIIVLTPDGSRLKPCLLKKKAGFEHYVMSFQSPTQLISLSNWRTDFSACFLLLLEIRVFLLRRRYLKMWGKFKLPPTVNPA